VESSIADYLALASASVDPAAMVRALQIVGLDDRVAMLPDGLQTMLSSTGYPLSFGKTMQLRLAAAILSRPRILVLSPLFDMVSKARLHAAFEHFAANDTTLIYFSNRPEDMTLDGFLWLGRHSQRIVGDRSTFDQLRRADGKEVADGR
jgi:putative ABC transport system ATP-binding protein